MDNSGGLSSVRETESSQAGRLLLGKELAVFDAPHVVVARVSDHERSSDDRLVFVLADSGVCPDCGGTGEYVGLNAKQKCGTCGGSGRT